MDIISFDIVYPGIACQLGTLFDTREKWVLREMHVKVSEHLFPN